MSDSLYQGRRFRTLNILDEGVREGLAIEVDTSLPAHRVVRVLQQLEAWRGLPKRNSLDTRTCPKAGGSMANAATASSVASSTRFLGIGFPPVGVDQGINTA